MLNPWRRYWEFSDENMVEKKSLLILQQLYACLKRKSLFYKRFKKKNKKKKTRNRK